jgi:hypothetical protein
MRRLGLALCSVAAIAAFTPLRGAERPLPLHGQRVLTARLLALVSDEHGARLAEVDPDTFVTRRASGRVGFGDGWALSPDRKALAVAVRPATSNLTFTKLLFANTSTLRWDRRGIRLDGDLRGALWSRSGTLLALVGDYDGPDVTLATIDPVRKRVVARRSVDGPVSDVARTDDGLVVLATAVNAIAPVRVIVIGGDGSLRSVTLARIRGGVHFDDESNDPLGTVRRPGLALDPAAGDAYVVDAEGLVARVRLADLAVEYHQTTTSPSFAIARLSRWLTPNAQAKGLNGPELQARWLGDGLLAVTRTDETATRNSHGDTVIAAQAGGLTVVDTADWRVRTLDPSADTAIVGDGILLASGGGWRSDGRSSTFWGAGIAAYGTDGKLRWRVDAGRRAWIVAAYGGRALVQQANDVNAPPHPLELVDLGSGEVLGTRAATTYPWLLLGGGS